MTKLQAGQVAVVTGGGSGIGRALALALSRRGLRIALADRDVDALDRTQAEFVKLGVDTIAVQTDVSSRPQMQSLHAAVIASFGQADLICNNAGIFNSTEPVWTKDAVRWRRLFEVNYWGVVHGIQEFVPGFIARGSGHVVNMASMSGLSVVAGLGDYAPAKHAVVALSEILRADLDAAGAGQIGVTVLCPAVVDTAMGRYAVHLPANAPRAAGMLSAEEVAIAAVDGIEAGRMYVTPTPNSKQRVLDRLKPILDSFAG
jgi:NAD(P)-dependent dehydrogenase (short-subunit alcohol dehydrogenase family)